VVQVAVLLLDVGVGGELLQPGLDLSDVLDLDPKMIRVQIF
jgi:hypothetical protein